MDYMIGPGQPSADLRGVCCDGVERTRSGLMGRNVLMVFLRHLG
jgi:hypothetical protein